MDIAPSDENPDEIKEELEEALDEKRDEMGLAEPDDEVKKLFAEDGLGNKPEDEHHKGYA